MSTLQAVVELVDKMSGPLATLTKNVSDFAKGIADGAKEELLLAKNGDEAAKSQNNLKTSLMDVGKALLGLKIGKEIMDAFGRSMSAADKLDDMAGKTGIASDKLKAYAHAAEMSDTSLETMVQGMNKLGRAMAMSEEETTKQAAAFSALGISNKNADGSLKSSEETFGAIADKFKDLKDGPEKAALAFAMFGQAGKDLIPMLNRGSAGIAELRAEAELLGQMGPNAFNAFTSSSGDMFDGLHKVRQMFEGLVDVITAEVVPVFNVVIQSFINSFKSGGMVAQIFDAIKVIAVGALVPAMKGVIVIFRGFADVLDLAGKSLGALGAIIAAVASGDIEGAKSIWKSYKEDVAKTAQEHVTFTDKLWDASNATDVVTKGLNNMGDAHLKNAPKIKKLAGEVKEAKSELEGMVAQLKIANSAFGLDESAKQKGDAQNKYEKDLKNGVDPAKAKALLDEANAQILINKILRDGKQAQDDYTKARSTVADDQLKVDILEVEAKMVGKSKTERDAAVQVLIDEADARKITNGLTGDAKKIIDDEIKSLQARRAAAKGTIADEERLQGLTGGTLVEQTKKAQEDIMYLAQAYQDGRIKSEEEYVQVVQLRLSQIKDANKVAADSITVFWEEAAKGMEQSMASFFFDAMQGKMTDLGASFKTLLDRMVANALAANLGNALLGDSFTKTGALGGWAKTGLDWLTGQFSGARATGGAVEAGKMYMVGEKGPEPFIPQTSGMILPNSSLKRSVNSGGQPIQINITAMDSQDVRRALEKDNRWLADLVNKSNRAYNLGM
jgi:hypothetical protein